ncbi:PDDEXK-like family protein [Zunongwangia atlantica]|uniref:PD-(D/E)XK nuclease superfamily protein n=1 Tax=Zunongwangia atlantica 22II14-10F7 TaxID=1185767 RepID=A0A1Y1SZ78_9FLAO|nr:PD-(D/E)XK nuclease family protein [Zunongwangia atlantica]ORL44058.1 hypothetical protein IIF7_17742 [Zunongwangia atlantica 22II14-10F7]
MKNYETLLLNVANTIEHQKELRILKGENFNLFTLLDIEYRENKTHSAIIAELLDPNGSHNLGDVFLKLFLDELNIEDSFFDLSSVTKHIEYNLGHTDLHNKTGGRLDILLKDQFNSTICIENKIYAVDQESQIERYCNFQTTGSNKVFYLNLYGDSPSSSSFGEKEEDEDFYVISYKKNIISWLSKCIKEASEYPILRESIKQYLILIKKLTNQLTDKSMEREIRNAIIKNYEAAQTITGNIEKVEHEFTLKLLEEVKAEIYKVLTQEEGWSIEISDDLYGPYSGFWLRFKNWPDDVSIKLEGQSKVPWQKSVFGIIASENIVSRESLNKSMSNILELQSGFKSNRVWPFYQTVLFFDDPVERQILFNDNSRNNSAKKIAAKFISIGGQARKPLSQLENIN